MLKTQNQLFNHIFQPASVWPRIQQELGTFIMAFAVILGVSYGFLLAIDFLPEPPEQVAATATYESEEIETLDSKEADKEEINREEFASLTENTDSLDTEIVPLEIAIDKLDRTIPILNPDSRNISVLDTALRSGAVRHPDSADLSQEGNMFILAHSSRLPNVINKNYQSFNDIDTLEWGDTIRVFSADKEYIYRVEKVYEAKASTVTVPIANTGSRLTLATCNSFGSRDDRFIVEASLQSQKPL